MFKYHAMDFARPMSSVPLRLNSFPQEADGHIKYIFLSLRGKRADKRVVVVTQGYFQQLRGCLCVSIQDTLDLNSQVPVVGLTIP